MLDRIKLYWPFTNFLTGLTRSSKPAKPLAKESSSTYRLANKCSQLTMERFMRCLCDDDLEELILEGSGATKEALDAMWIVIISEYQELRGDSIDLVTAIRLTKLIRRTEHHLYLFNKCVGFLVTQYSQVIAESLYALGYPFKPKSQEPIEYASLLTNCINRSKGKFIQLQGWIKELKELPVDDSKATREQFEETLVAIEELQHVAYNLETMTVTKFLMLERRLRNHIQKWQSKG